jgi:hypothetical protein
MRHNIGTSHHGTLCVLDFGLLKMMMITRGVLIITIIITMIIIIRG